MSLTFMEADTASTIIEQAIERLTGDSIAHIRSRSLEETRNVAELRHRGTFRFITRFPLIGRGNVLRDRILTREQVEESLDRSLGSGR